MDSAIGPRVLRTPEAARFIGLSTSTLEKLRSCSIGPRFVKLGTRAIGYDVRDLEMWIEDRRREGEAATG
jgi:predicted DNA-binding transcriptional regulator AlpA